MKKNLFDKLSKIIKKQQQIHPRNTTQSNTSNKLSTLYNLKNQYLKQLKQSKGFFNKHDKQQPQKKQSLQNVIKSIWNKTINQYPSNISTIKSKLKDSTQSLKQYTQQNISSSLNSLKNKSQEISSVLDQKIKKKSQQVTKIIGQKAQDIKDGLSNSKQQITKKATQIKKNIGQTSQKTFEKLKQNTDVKKNLKKSFNFIFWRVTLLLGIIAFCYGMGSAFPKIIKNFIVQHLSKNQDENKEQSGKTDRTIF